VAASREDTIIFISSTGSTWKSETGGLGLAIGDADGNQVVAVAGSIGVKLYSENKSSVIVTTTASEAPLVFFDADNDNDFDLASVSQGGNLVYYEYPDWTSTLIFASGVTAIATTEDYLLFANASTIFRLSLPLPSSPVIMASDFFDIISLSIIDDRTLVLATQLDDSVWLLDILSFELSRIAETAHGIVDVNAARLDGISLYTLTACRDDRTLRKYSTSLSSQQNIIDQNLKGIAAVAFVDLDSDTAIDAVTVADDGVFSYQNLNCPIISSNDDPSDTGSKKKGRSTSVTLIVVFVIVAALALLAVCVFFRTEYAADISRSIHNSIRRIRSRSLLSTPSSSQHQINNQNDSSPSSRNEEEKQRIQAEIEAARARALGLEESVGATPATEMLTLRVDDDGNKK